MIRGCKTKIVDVLLTVNRTNIRFVNMQYNDPVIYFFIFDYFLVFLFSFFVFSLSFHIHFSILFCIAVSQYIRINFQLPSNTMDQYINPPFELAISILNIHVFDCL